MSESSNSCSRRAYVSQRCLNTCRDLLIDACNDGSDVKSLHDFEAAQQGPDAMADATDTHPCKATTLLVPGRHRLRVTLLPPLPVPERSNPLALVDIAKAADVVLLCMAIVEAPGGGSGKGTGASGEVDAQAQLALQVLRGMGMPKVLVATRGGGVSMKERAAAKKAAAAALAAELPGELKVSRLSDCCHMQAGALSRQVQDVLLVRLPIFGLIRHLDSMIVSSVMTAMLERLMRHADLATGRHGRLRAAAAPPHRDLSGGACVAAPAASPHGGGSHLPGQRRGIWHRDLGTRCVCPQRGLERKSAGDHPTRRRLRDRPGVGGTAAGAAAWQGCCASSRPGG
jgi:hypothetical protein